MHGLACEKQETDEEVKCLSPYGVLLTAVEFQTRLENPEAFLHLPAGFVSLENLFSRPEHAVGSHKIALSAHHIELDPIGQFPLGLAISPWNAVLNLDTGKVSSLTESGDQGPAIIIQAFGNRIAEIRPVKQNLFGTKLKVIAKLADPFQKQVGQFRALGMPEAKTNGKGPVFPAPQKENNLITRAIPLCRRDKQGSIPKS